MRTLISLTIDDGELEAAGRIDQCLQDARPSTAPGGRQIRISRRVSSAKVRCTLMQLSFRQTYVRFLWNLQNIVRSFFALFSDEFDSVLERLVDAVMEQPLKSNLVEKRHLEEAVKHLNAKVGPFLLFIPRIY